MGYFRWPSLNLLNGESKNMVVIFPENDYFWERVEKGVEDARNYYSTWDRDKFSHRRHNLTQQNQLLENILQKET